MAMFRTIAGRPTLWLLTLMVSTSACTGLQVPRATPTPADTPTPEATLAPVPPRAAAPELTPTDFVPLTWLDSGWKTDFSRRSVPLREIRSGEPPRDGIPPIDDPRIVSVSEADA